MTRMTVIIKQEPSTLIGRKTTEIQDSYKWSPSPKPSTSQEDSRLINPPIRKQLSSINQYYSRCSTRKNKKLILAEGFPIMC